LEKIGKGTTRIPAFNIISWIDRPLGMDAVGADHSVPAAVPVYTPRPSFVPPVEVPAKSAMAAAVADDEMF
jgi:hypothetical protein